MQFSCEWRMKTKNRPLVADDFRGIIHFSLCEEYILFTM